MGDKVPAPGSHGVEEGPEQDSSRTCLHSPFVAIQRLQALSLGGAKQASPMTELGHCRASEAAQTLLAAPGHELGNRAATHTGQWLTVGPQARLLGWDANELCDNELFNFPVPGAVYC